jgi:tripartite-type tricarboxylate transporter receptor subunit TctC
MNKSSLTVVFAVFAASTMAPAAPGAQSFPDRPIKIVVPYSAGGPTDTLARVATQGLGAELGGSVVIENLPGAGGRLGTEGVIRAVPDGYTLLCGGSNEYAITPALYKNLGYDPVKGLAPVAPLAIDSNAIVVNPSVPVHSLADLARYSKEHPGSLTSGATIGIVPHLAIEFFRAHFGADIVFVPYKGAALAIADALGNHIQVASSAKSVLLPLIKSGKLRALAVTSAERWPELPDVPTFHESGLTSFPTEYYFGLMAPAGTPQDVVARINAAENARLKSSEIRAALAKLGVQTRLLTPSEYTNALTEDMRTWKTVIDEAGVRLD